MELERSWFRELIIDSAADEQSVERTLVQMVAFSSASLAVGGLVAVWLGVEGAWTVSSTGGVLALGAWWQLVRGPVRLDWLVYLFGAAVAVTALLGMGGEAVAVAGLVVFAAFAPLAFTLRRLIHGRLIVVLLAATAVGVLIRLDVPVSEMWAGLAALAGGAVAVAVFHWFANQVNHLWVGLEEALLDVGPHVLVVDAHQRVVKTKPGFLDWYGAETVDHTLTEAVGSDIADLVAAFIDSEATSHQISAQPFPEAKTPNGNRPVAIHLRRLTGFPQPLFVVALRDMTEQVEYTERLHALISSRTRLLESMAHALRTPLTAILGFSQLGADQELPAADQKELPQLVAMNAAKMSHTLDDMLVAAKAEIGGLEFKLAPHRLSELARKAVASVGAAIEVKTTPAEEDALVDGDRVVHAVRNLIRNAVQYGGPSQWIEIARDDGELTLSVCDDGPSLDSDILTRDFDPAHIHGGTASQPSPLGLGLAVARYLIKHMGGTITYAYADSVSRFQLGFPVWDGGQTSGTQSPRI